MRYHSGCKLLRAALGMEQLCPNGDVAHYLDAGEIQVWLPPIHAVEFKGDIYDVCFKCRDDAKAIIDLMKYADPQPIKFDFVEAKIIEQPINTTGANPWQIRQISGDPRYAQFDVTFTSGATIANPRFIIQTTGTNV